MRQTGTIYARGNNIVNTFRNRTDDVKCKLFKAYNVYQQYPTDIELCILK